MGMTVIGALSSIEPGQYWKVETAGPLGSSLTCVAKPSFICTISQTLAFAEVMEIATKALKEEGLDEDKAEMARENLADRYTSLLENQWYLGKIITSLFLWIWGFTGDDSLDSMAEVLKINCYAAGDIKQEDLIALAQKRPFLRNIHFSRSNVNDQDIEIVTKECPRLSKIELYNCHNISDKSLLSLAQNCPHLSDVSVQSCYLIGNRGVKALAENLSGLTHINLNFCEEIDDESLKSLAENCHLLKNINLYYCDKISDEGIKALAEKCGQLTSIDLSYCKKISDEGIKTLAEKCAGLKTIYADQCHKISEKCLKFLQETYPELKIVTHIGNAL